MIGLSTGRVKVLSHGAERPVARIASVVDEGKPAPDFSLTSDSGEAVSLADLRGAPVVLYFYPKDDTPATFTQ